MQIYLLRKKENIKEKIKIKPKKKHTQTHTQNKKKYINNIYIYSFK